MAAGQVWVSGMPLILYKKFWNFGKTNHSHMRLLPRLCKALAWSAKSDHDPCCLCKLYAPGRTCYSPGSTN